MAMDQNQESVHLDGHFVHVERRGVTKPHEQVRIKGEGMPVRRADDDDDAEGGGEPQRHGDLVVEVIVDFPEALSPKAAEWAASALPE